MNLGELGEFGFVELMRTWVESKTSGVGIGDDAAVLRPRPGAAIVAGSDALVEDVHFRLDWSTPVDAGFKAVSVNVSDLAAMGAKPRWILLSLCAPPSTDVDVLRRMYAGLAEACALYGCELVGGDTVTSDGIVLSLTAIGELDGDPLLRSGARPGDVVAVTGMLGKAAAGLDLLLSGDSSDEISDAVLACLDAHRRPVARVAEGLELKDAGAHAAIDVSDGLASDARRLAEASGAGVEIDASRLPVAPEARAVAEQRGWDVQRMVLAGGEDLELLVALERSDEAPVVEIGRVVEGQGVWLVDGATRVDIADLGYDHFARR